MSMITKISKVLVVTIDITIGMMYDCAVIVPVTTNSTPEETRLTMNQIERRRALIRYLLDEGHWRNTIPENETEQKRLLRGLMNVRPAEPVSEEFLEMQDEYLQEALAEKGTVSLADMEELQPELYLWRGDITRIQCGAIVNAANSGMTGCWQPCHSCIDNCIHTYAGVQLRLKCAELMDAQGHEEPTGQAKITPAYNLPCNYILHTVGPIVEGPLTAEHERLLASCYRSCLQLAAENGVESIAFCCISTGVFMFPNDKAARIATQTVKDWKAEMGSGIKVIFNVFKEQDERLYRALLTD